MAFLLFLTALGPGAPPRDAALVRDGRPAGVLVTADRPTAAAAAAAALLQDYLRKASGAEVPVVAESKLPPGDGRARLLVGESRRTAALGLDPAKFEREQILLKTFGNELAILGDDARPDGLPLQGTLWAAARFAEEVLGIRHLWPGPLGEVVPRRPTVELPALDETYVPPLWQRKIRNIGLNERVEAGLRTLGWRREDFLSKQAESEPWWRFHRIGGSFRGEYGHAFGDYWERFHKDHPEWFALQPDGTRDNSRADGGRRCRLCKSNRGLIEQVARDVLERMRRDPRADTVSISPNDGGPAAFCSCPDCEAWDAPEGETVEIWNPGGTVPHVSLTDRVVRFYAAVAEIVAREFPDRLLGAYAYSAYRNPPIRAKLPPNVMIGYVGFDYLNEAERRKSREHWREWSRVARRLFLRPNFLSAGHGLPLVYVRRLAEDLRFCAEHGLLVTDFDCGYQHWATDGLNYYVLARLLWDPRQDVDGIVEDYCRAGFGKAAPAVRAYFDDLERMTDALAESGEYRDRKRTMDVLVRRYTDDFLTALKGRLDEARRLAGEDRAVLERIGFLETALRYAPLRRDWTLARQAHRERPSPETAGHLREAQARKDVFYRQLGLSWTLNVPYLLFYGF